jgi:hypothetical protein
MSITLRTGEYLWSSAGTHVCNENGFSTRCNEDTEVVFDSQEIEDRAVAVIRDDRTFRGMDPDTGLEPVPEE